MLLANVMEGADQAAFQHREEPLHAVGGRLSASIFALPVINNVMSRETPTEAGVGAVFVGVIDPATMLLKFGNAPSC